MQIIFVGWGSIQLYWYIQCIYIYKGGRLLHLSINQVDLSINGEPMGNLTRTSLAPPPPPPLRAAQSVLLLNVNPDLGNAHLYLLDTHGTYLVNPSRSC